MQFKPALEALEPRLAAYAADGPAWPAGPVTAAVMLDGTVVHSGYVSDLPDGIAPLFARALGVWERACNIDFVLVPDDGAAWGAPTRADVRLGGVPTTSSYRAIAWLPRFGSDSSKPGDILLNTTKQYDALAVMIHEIGHAIGLGHSDDPANVMYPRVRYGRHALAADDARRAVALYGAPRWTSRYVVIEPGQSATFKAPDHPGLAFAVYDRQERLMGRARNGVFHVEPATNRRRVRVWYLASATLTVDLSPKPE
jgi:hypothetical protein